MFASSIVIPKVEQAEAQFETQPAKLYRQWREAKAEVENEFVIENVRFEHRADWNSGVMSMECARARGHPIWQVVSVLFYLSATGYGAFFFLRF